MEITKDQRELAAARRREFDDLQNEIAGRETGRRARFLKDGAGSDSEKKKKREEQQALTRLAQLLNDPVYRAKYDSVVHLLAEAERATETAIARITDQIRAAEADLNDIMERAARLPDGTRVYRDAEGFVRREDGSVVEDYLVDTIIWTGDEPSFEDLQSAKTQLDGLQAALDDVQGYQYDILGPARDEISDPDDPPSLSDLDDIENAIQSQMPKAVQEQMPQTSAATPEVATQSIGLPKLGG
ncbi:hypothetical protein [Cognatiyoonia sp. IB215182]|uniref:hypothetical protein n=1 Tax=Cognatiyoonia sp. IB215182 TaxID=3097353 RepID=UPI002A0C95B8|nr:hypothetical protein [Cognatiyoonia sp. IB215182]MDX8353980.1 hypothetical protein [Cognatiyoonia sp. IB215182]